MELEQQRRDRWREFFSDALTMTADEFVASGHFNEELLKKYLDKNSFSAKTSEEEKEFFKGRLRELCQKMKKYPTLFKKFLKVGRGYSFEEYVLGVEECHSKENGKGIQFLGRVNFSMGGSIDYHYSDLREFYDAIVPDLKLFFSFVKTDLAFATVVRSEDGKFISETVV